MTNQEDESKKKIKLREPTSESVEVGDLVQLVSYSRDFDMNLYPVIALTEHSMLYKDTSGHVWERNYSVSLVLKSDGAFLIGCEYFANASEYITTETSGEEQ